MDVYMEQTMFRQQKDESRSPQTQDSLYSHGQDGATEGPYDGHVMRSSAYTRAMLSDVTRALPYIAAGVAVAEGVRRWQRVKSA
jgi:hypothetical protein